MRKELLTYNPLIKIKVPKAEKKVVKALSYAEVSQIVFTFGNRFEDKRNKVIYCSPLRHGLN